MEPGGSGVRGYWMRAFACAALLRASGERENDELRQGQNSSLIQLIDSLHLVGAELGERAAAFLAWLLLRFEPDQEDEDVCFFGVGLLWFALQLPSPAPADTIVSLSKWIVAREKQLPRHNTRLASRWMLGTNLFDQRSSAWERLGRALEELDLSGRSPVAREWVMKIGRELAGR